MNITSGSILTSLLTIGGVIISNRLSAYFASSAKVWDLKREAYGVILSRLGSVSRILYSAQDYINEDRHGYFDGETMKKHDEMIRGFMLEANDRFSNDYLVLSPAFTAQYEAMQSDLDQARDADFPDDHEDFADAVWKHRPLLLAQAQREIAGRLHRKRFVRIRSVLRKANEKNTKIFQKRHADHDSI